MAKNCTAFLVFFFSHFKTAICLKFVHPVCRFVGVTDSRACEIGGKGGGNVLVVQTNLYDHRCNVLPCNYIQTCLSLRR